MPDPTNTPSFTYEQLKLIHDLCVDAEGRSAKKAEQARDQNDHRTAAYEMQLQEHYTDIREKIAEVLVKGTTTTQDMLRDIRKVTKGITDPQ
jgi:hypothetical protein